MLKQINPGIIVLLASSLTAVGFRWAHLSFDVSSLVFAATTLLAGGLLLIAFAGPGPLTKETILDKDTWVWGITQLITTVLFIALVGYISSSDAATLQRFSLIFSFMITLSFSSRKPSLREGTGIALCTVAIFMVLKGLPEDVFGPALTLTLVASLMKAIRSHVGESHKTNNKAKKIDDQARVSGFILFCTSLIFIMIILALAVIKAYSGIESHLVDSFPDLKDFMNPFTVYASILMGVLLVSVSKYFEFVAVKTIGPLKLLAYAALMPVLNYLFELLLGLFGAMTPTVFEMQDMVTLGLVTAGSALIIFSGKKKTVTAADTDATDAFEPVVAERKKTSDLEKEIITSTLAFYQGDVQKTATTLKVPVHKVEECRNGL